MLRARWRRRCPVWPVQSVSNGRLLARGGALSFRRRLWPKLRRRQLSIVRNLPHGGLVRGAGRVPGCMHRESILPHRPVVSGILQGDHRRGRHLRLLVPGEPYRQGTRRVVRGRQRVPFILLPTRQHPGQAMLRPVRCREQVSERLYVCDRSSVFGGAMRLLLFDVRQRSRAQGSLPRRTNLPRLWPHWHQHAAARRTSAARGGTDSLPRPSVSEARRHRLNCGSSRGLAFTFLLTFDLSSDSQLRAP